MPFKETARAYRALYPEELIERYNAGERDFSRINLLRAELERILGIGPALVEIWHSKLEKFNPLWADFTNPVEKRFEWDSYGRFIPTEINEEIPLRDLSSANLSSINLEGSYLYLINLRNANLSGANLRNTIFIDADLQGANLNKADLRHSILWTSDLRGANLYMARLERATLTGTDLRNADLTRAKLQRANLSDTDLRRATLQKAHFGGTLLNWANLEGTDLKEVRLKNVYVRGMTIAESQRAELLSALGIRISTAK